MGALAGLRAFDRRVLYDLAWLRRCPLLDELRRVEKVQDLAREITSRWDRVWAMTPAA